MARRRNLKDNWRTTSVASHSASPWAKKGVKGSGWGVLVYIRDSMEIRTIVAISHVAHATALGGAELFRCHRDDRFRQPAAVGGHVPANAAKSSIAPTIARRSGSKEGKVLEMT